MPFDRRGERCDEYLAVMRSLWLDEVSSSRRVLRPSAGAPVPEAGAAAASADPRRWREQRCVASAGRLCEGWYGYNLDPAREARHEAAVVDRRRAASERCDGQRVPVPATDRPEEIDGYAEAGVDQLVLLASIRSTDDIERVLDPLAAVMSRAL